MIRKRLSYGFACLLALGLSGCGLFYDNSYEGSSFRIYSDRNEEFISRVGATVEQIYAGYEDLFELESRSLGDTTIVLEGTDGEVIADDASSVLGYYVPLFNFISIDTRRPWTHTDETLRQVLLHEVAHHFIVTEHPRASRQCWLNEGLAGNLEVSLFERDRFECPLLNPTLFYLAQQTVHEGECPSLKDFIHLSWHDFHGPDSKERNYALAWSLVYFLVERHLPSHVPLGKRFEVVYQMPLQEIELLEKQWLEFLRGFDVAGHLLRLATQPRNEEILTARWAVVQLANVRPLDSLRVLRGLVPLFDDPDTAKRTLAYITFIRTIERHPHSYFLSDGTVQQGLAHIGRVMNDPAQSTELGESMARALEFAKVPPEALGSPREASASVISFPRWNGKVTPSSWSVWEASPGQ